MWRPHTCTYKPYVADRVHISYTDKFIQSIDATCKQTGFIFDELLQGLVYVQHFAELTGSAKNIECCRLHAMANSNEVRNEDDKHMPTCKVAC